MQRRSARASAPLVIGIASLALVVAGFAQCLIACSGSLCGFRGGPDSYFGNETFLVAADASNESATSPASAPPASGLASATRATATIDWDPYAERRDDSGQACSEEDTTLTVVTKECSLFAAVSSVAYGGISRTSGDSFTSASAGIGGGRCTLATASGGKVNVDIESGSIQWDDSLVMRIDATGSVSSASGGAPSTGVVTVSFVGETN